MSSIRLISWNLTRSCNLACGHCYLNARQRTAPSEKDLSTAEALTVMAGLADAAPGAMVVLTGGEPLLRADLEELVRAAVASRLTAVIGTNGLLLDDARARSLRDAGAAGVGISVDSTIPEVHDAVRGQPGAWIGAMRGIAAARCAGLPILVQATLFERNRREIGRLVDLARDVGATAVNFFFLVCTGRGATQTDITPEAYDEALRTIMVLQDKHDDILVRARCAPYIRRLKGLRAGEARGSFADFSSACLAGRSYIRITPEGMVTPCPYIPQAIGNLKMASLGDVLAESTDIRRLRDDVPAGKCGRCEWRLSCGGCRARALALAGDLMAEDPRCTYQPAAGSVPETVSSAETPGGPRWHPEAEARLSRIPDFVRARVQKRLEEKAADQGLAEITPEFMQANRPPWLLGKKPRPGPAGRIPPYWR